MSYSTIDFIKRNCTLTYDLDNLDDLSEQLHQDSKLRYSVKSSKKILCRYIGVKNGKIYFDPDNRNVEQTYEDVEIMLNKSKKKYDNDSCQTQKVIRKGFGNLSNVKTDDEQTNDNDSCQTQKVIRKGFGNLSNVKTDDEQTNDNDSCQTQKVIRKGFGNLSNVKTDDKTNQNNLSSVKTVEPSFNQNKKTNRTCFLRKTKNINMFDDEITDVEKRRQKIYRKLASRYYPAQRSEEWFKMRNEMITASDGGTIVNLNPYEPDFSFIVKKVFGKPFETSIDCYHGKKFEQVATMIYEYRLNVKVKEFGLCQHPDYKFLGASPDGIVSEYKLQTKSKTWEELDEEVNLISDEKSKREFLDNHCFKTNLVGRMLEIKCPMRRKILMDDNAIEVYGPHGEKITNLLKDVKKGICPAYYWVQVQLQLQCCELDECDFWQCELVEYSDRQEFIEDSDDTKSWLSKSTSYEKGALIQLMPIENLTDKNLDYDNRIYNFAQFIYQPRVDMTNEEIDEWVINTILNLKYTHKGMVFESVKYWRLNVSRNITIKRDDKWFEENLDKFETIWNKVEFYREHKERADLMKNIIESFAKDRWGKTKEIHFGQINELINKIFNVPSDNDKKIKHHEYAKLIQNLVQKYEKNNIDDNSNDDIEKDIQFIVDTMNIEDNSDKKRKLIKLIREQIDDYVFD